MIVDGSFIGHKARQTMINNRALYLMRDNAQLPLDVATDLSIHMQDSFEAWCGSNGTDTAAGDSFDLLKEIALSYTPAS